MTRQELDRLSDDEVLALMEREGLEVVHSFFATIHHRSENRPDGYTGDELDEIAGELADGDGARWRRQLAEHFAAKGD